MTLEAVELEKCPEVVAVQRFGDLRESLFQLRVLIEVWQREAMSLGYRDGELDAVSLSDLSGKLVNEAIGQVDLVQDAVEPKS